MAKLGKMTRASVKHIRDLRAVNEVARGSATWAVRQIAIRKKYAYATFVPQKSDVS